MRARVLRGSAQVGGSLVELEQDGDRIVLDVGRPLEAVAHRDLLPDVAGLWAQGDGSLKGVFITHGHPDHYGLADLVDLSVPIYMGKAAKAVLDAAAFYTDRPPGFECAGFLEDGTKLIAGSFEVTPFLVDHSGFDAYGLLVRAGGESLFYTGDIRFHGRKSHRMVSLADRLPENLDCLLMEGTDFDRAGGGGPSSEKELEDDLVGSFGTLDGAAVCFYSAQNIDRLVTLFRASKRSGRTFVYDLYGATVAAATGNPNIPQPTWDEVKVCLREGERRRVLQTKQFERVNSLRDHRVYREEIAEDPSRYVLTGRSSSVRELARSGCLSGARGYWSQWAGYLERDLEQSRLFRDCGLEMEVAHVSGHATAQDLVEFARGVGASQTVPVHTGSPGYLAGRLVSFRPTNDGEWWSLTGNRRSPHPTSQEEP